MRLPTRRPVPQTLSAPTRRWNAVALLLLGVLLPLLAVAALTDDVFRKGGFGWDQTVLAWYRAHRTPELTRIAEALGVLGGVRVLPLITLAVVAGLYRARARAHALFLVLAVGGATLLNVMTKLVFQRPRPDVLEAVLHEPGFSFPSGHAMANAAFGIAITLIFWRSRAGWPVAVLGALWAVLVGASRNYLGVHYPSDVLAGALSSLVWVVGLYLLMARFRPSLRGSPAGERDSR